MTDELDPFRFDARFDVEVHTLDALELILEKLQTVLNRPTSWKWVTIGLHSAMHGAFALVLKRSDGAQLLPRKLEQKVYESWERERATGVIEFVHYDHVDWFMELYKKSQDPQRMSYLGGSPLVPSGDQDESIVKLNDFRGRLLHFSASSWVIDPMNFIDMLNDLLPVLRFLYFEAQHGAFLDQEHDELARELLVQIEAETLRVQLVLEEESQRHKTRSEP